MPNEFKRKQIVLEGDHEIQSIAKDYLKGDISLEQAATKMPKAKLGVLDYVLMVVLPDDLYRRRKILA